MKHALTFIILVSFATCTFAQPATAPTTKAEDIDFSPMPGMSWRGENNFDTGGTLKLLFSPGAMADEEIIHELVARLHWSSGGDKPMLTAASLTGYVAEPGNAYVSFQVMFPSAANSGVPGGVAFGGVLDVQQVQNYLQSQREIFAAKLNSLAGKAKGMTPEEIQEKLKAVKARLAQTFEKMQVLSGLAKVQEGWEAQVQRKVQQLQADQLKLELSLSPKEARRAALEKTIAEQKSRVQDEQAKDEISAQLKRIVEEREVELARYKNLEKTQAVGSPEVSQAEAKVAEAKIPLLERQATLAKRGKGELLDRLADELAMVSVDVTEIRLQLKNIEEELRKYDLANARPEDLDRLAQERARVPEPNALPPLYYELEKQRLELMKEIFGLQVADVKLIDEPAKAPEH